MRPDYYKGENNLQPIHLIDALGLGFYEGNIVKYVCRHTRKNGLEDLIKAQFYLNRLVDIEQKKAEAKATGYSDEWYCHAYNCRHHASKQSIGSQKCDKHKVEPTWVQTELGGDICMDFDQWNPDFEQSEPKDTGESEEWICTALACVHNSGISVTGDNCRCSKHSVKPKWVKCERNGNICMDFEHSVPNVEEKPKKK